MKALQFSGVGIANKSIFLRPYLSSSSLGFPSRCPGLDERYIHGLKVPVSIKRKPFASTCFNGSSTRISEYEENKGVRYTEDYSEKSVDDTIKFYSTLSPSETKAEENLHVSQEHAAEQKGYAKIHDFCFGIPYGGFLFTGGLFGYLLTRNSVSLTTSMLGAAVLVFAAISLKVWRKGLSSLPFMLGQAALAAAVLLKHFQTYSLTKNLFPSGLYIFMSAAILCFYSYVLFSGGNPPPKRNLAASL
ncbi:hypothetical protein KSP40_PGU000253 [Platanthera guangdongensis]|uniref:Protein FATTY ACID EXPORT 1, chloroplastic n=1 Tax=Platanthera guangdongensis TaxID=2320717 RepID=A0ABR2LW95_9ASPA